MNTAATKGKHGRSTVLEKEILNVLNAQNVERAETAVQWEYNNTTVWAACT